MLAAALVAAALGVQAHNVGVSISRDGPRPAAGRLERRAHTRMRRRFESAGLDVRVQRFSAPRGRSRNVIGVHEGGRCLRVLMAHADTVPPSCTFRTRGASPAAARMALTAARNSRTWTAQIRVTPGARGSYASW